MSKISTYEVAPVPKLSDKLIGTSVGGEIEDVTYNFTLQELLDVFLPVIPANNLQGILDYGNTATQDINLFGTITTTNLEVTDTANLFITYLNEETHIVGSVFDSADSVGTAGQVLTSTGEGVEWYTLPPIFTPNLQQVLEVGNTADIDIVLDANIQALDVSADTANISTQLSIQGVVVDYNESAGTAGQVLESTVTGVQWTNLPVYSATSPLLFNSATGVFSIQVANSTQGGYLTANDWVTFNGKQDAGSYITALTGEATATGPGSVPITLNNASVISKVLTGLNVTGGSISATDSILTAFGKVQSQINGLMGGVQYQGTWDAATNTPTLTSSVGTQGYYYIVSVDGNTNLNGITDWKVGDWAIFSGGVWQKVDNTDSVTSVNGFTGAVSLTTDNIPEGLTNLYFTDGRARAALTATSPLLYNNISGVFSIQQSSGSQNGYLSSTDWNTFNDKQNYLGGTGLVKSTAGTITYITDNSGNWNTAYNDSIVSAAVTGTSTKTLTLNQQDGGTIQASWSDIDTGLTSVGLSMPVAFSVANTPLTSNGTLAVTAVGSATQYIRGDGQLATFPTSGGGGSSINYYLNGSVPASVVGYEQMANSAVIGGGTDFNLVGNGLIAQFLTDVGNPNRILIPGGAWNAEMFFSVSSAGGNQKFYLELLKYDGVVFTLIASGITNPEEITGGIATDLYLTSLAVPETTLLITDRLAIRVYIVDNSVGRTVTLHTEDNNLCQIITTFSGGISALNGLTANTQYFAVGTAGTDFAINSLLDTHTFNLPTSSATKRGALSNVDWITFNNKQAALTLTTTGTSGAATLVGATLNIPQYQSVLTNPVTGTGTTNTLPKFTSASTIGNSNITDTGSLITLGSNSLINGNVGIGSTPTATIGLLISRNITGAGTSYGTYSNGTIQSDVTTNATYHATFIGTAAASFTVNNAYGHYVAGTTIGAGSAITTQQAFYAHSNFTGATNNYGFRGAIPSGTNRWNLYMDGTADNYLAGSLGIGSTALTGYTLRLQKSITGATTGYGMIQEGTVQSDVTTIVYGIRNNLNTASASFTILDYVHYFANQSNIGSGSTINNQYGFNAPSNLIGATNNFGFYGGIPSGSNRWNIYMAGTANNYMAGSLGIGSITLTGYSLVIGKNMTGAANAQGVRNNGVIQSDVTGYAVMYNSLASTAAAAFTNSQLIHYYAQQGTIGAGSSVTYQYGFVAESNLTGASNNYGFYGAIPSGTNRWNLHMAGTAANYMAGKLLIGSTTDVASASVAITSTTQGFLPPRMTLAQRTAIASPATGLIVYQTDGVEGLWLRTSTGWRELTVV